MSPREALEALYALKAKGAPKTAEHAASRLAALEFARMLLPQRSIGSAAQSYPTRTDHHHRDGRRRRRDRRGGARHRPAARARAGASRSSSRTRAAPRMSSARKPSPRRRPTAIRCCSPRPGPSSSIRRSTAKASCPYDEEKDFIPITGIVRINQALLGHPSLAARHVRELIALARSKPGELTYGTAGRGLGAAHEHGVVREHGRREAPARALSRRGAGAHRRDRRARQSDVGQRQPRPCRRCAPAR